MTGKDPKPKESKMKRCALLAIILATCGCAAYDREMVEKERVEKNRGAVEVFYSKKPERPYEEIAAISVRSVEDAQENRRAIQGEVARLGGDAGVVTGHHTQSKLSLLTFTGDESQDYIDVVAIKWSKSP